MGAVLPLTRWSSPVQMIPRTRAAALAALPLLAVLVAGCDVIARDEAVQSMPASDHGAVAGVGAGKSLQAITVSSARAEREASRRSAPPPAPQSTPAPARFAAQSPSVASAMIIRNGSVSIRVDSLEPAMDAVKALAASLGGIVANVSVMNGEREVRSAQLELRLPAARFDEAMAGVRPLGKVEHASATAQDVGEEYVDIAARVANAKRLEQRLVSLLATRTGKLEDVLAVERELARVREEIERHEGRLRFLDTRIATSTIVVSVHEPAPLVAAHPGANPIRMAFVNMWRNFVLFVAFGIEALGVVIPVGLLALVAWVGWRRWRRIAPALDSSAA